MHAKTKDPTEKTKYVANGAAAPKMSCPDKKVYEINAAAALVVMVVIPRARPRMDEGNISEVINHVSGAYDRA